MIFAGMGVNEEVKNKPNCVVFGRDLMSEWAFHEKNFGLEIGPKKKKHYRHGISSRSLYLMSFSLRCSCHL